MEEREGGGVLIELHVGYTTKYFNGSKASANSFIIIYCQAGGFALPLNLM